MPVDSPLMQRVIGIDLVTLRRAARVVGIAGGTGKVEAILASLRGKWINVLITDRQTAERLIDLEKEPSGVAATMVKTTKKRITSSLR